MTPTSNAILPRDFQIAELPSRTYRVDPQTHKLSGFIDGLEAVRQSIFYTLSTERFDFEIFSWNYGMEKKDLFGMPTGYVVTDLPRRIREALARDTRIVDVFDFNFSVTKIGETSARAVSVTFTARTIFGDSSLELERYAYV